MLTRFRILSSRHEIISKKNWEAVHPNLLRAIESADFISFDYELTGLHIKNDRYLGLDVAYAAHSEGVKSYIPVQLGICAARFDTLRQKWILTPASIYLYPSSVDESGRTFSMSTAAMNFLVSNGFNCNEWISHGLSWLRPIEEQDKRRAIKLRMDEIRAGTAVGKPEAPTGVFEFPSESDRELMESLARQIVDWQKSDLHSPLQVPMESAFTRLLAHSYIAHAFPGLFSSSVRRDEKRFLCVYKNRAELQKEQLVALEHEMRQIDRLVGARSLFDTISSRKIPLVGHNCFYDLLHTYQTFFEEVPPHVEQFKAKWMSRFSRTFDTKHLAECNEILGGLHPPATLKGLCDFMIANNGLEGVQIEPLSSDFQYSLPSATSNDHSHDAGYDAMMTSLVFILQLGHIMERKSLKWDMVDWKGGSVKTTTGAGLKVPVQEVLRQSVNRIRLVKSQPSVINLAERQ
jgi:poly(A)-specific ribonuclease